MAAQPGGVPAPALPAEPDTTLPGQRIPAETSPEDSWDPLQREPGYALKQRVDERSDCGALRENDKEAEQKQDQEHGGDPPPLVLYKELEQLASDTHPVRKAFKKGHIYIPCVVLKQYTRKSRGNIQRV